MARNSEDWGGGGAAGVHRRCGNQPKPYTWWSVHQIIYSDREKDGRTAATGLPPWRAYDMTPWSEQCLAGPLCSNNYIPGNANFDLNAFGLSPPLFLTVRLSVCIRLIDEVESSSMRPQKLSVEHYLETF